MISLESMLGFSLALFCVGVYGLLVRRNFLFMLLSLEIMLNAAGVLFVAASRIHQNVDGELMYLLLLTLAASEVALGLGLVIHMHRSHQTLDVDRLSELRD